MVASARGSAVIQAFASVSPGRDVRIGPEVCRLEYAEACAETVGGARREQKPDAEREQDDAGDGEDVGSVVLEETRQQQAAAPDRTEDDAGLDRAEDSFARAV